MWIPPDLVILVIEQLGRTWEKVLHTKSEGRVSHRKFSFDSSVQKFILHHITYIVNVENPVLQQQLKPMLRSSTGENSLKKKRPPHLQSFTTVPFHVYSLTQNLRLKKCKYFRLLGNETKTKKKSVCMCIYLQMIQYFTGTKQFKREELDKIARKILGTRIVWGFTFDKSWSFKKQLHRISQTWIRWA